MPLQGEVTARRSRRNDVQHVAFKAPILLSEKSSLSGVQILEPGMDEHISTSHYDEDMIDILPPQPGIRAGSQTSTCDCCGRPAVLDEDCCGICEECLSP